jgi:hypothetical protein
MLLVDVLVSLPGTAVEVLSALVIVAPVLMPARFGLDPLHFAMVMAETLIVASITPPVGMALMTAAQIVRVSYERAIRCFPLLSELHIGHRDAFGMAASCLLVGALFDKACYRRSCQLPFIERIDVAIRCTP